MNNQYHMNCSTECSDSDIRQLREQEINPLFQFFQEIISDFIKEQQVSPKQLDYYQFIYWLYNYLNFPANNRQSLETNNPSIKTENKSIHSVKSSYIRYAQKFLQKIKNVIQINANDLNNQLIRFCSQNIQQFRRQFPEFFQFFDRRRQMELNLANNQPQCMQQEKRQSQIVVQKEQTNLYSNNAETVNKQILNSRKKSSTRSIKLRFNISKIEKIQGQSNVTNNSFSFQIVSDSRSILNLLQKYSKSSLKAKKQNLNRIQTKQTISSIVNRNQLK